MDGGSQFNVIEMDAVGGTNDSETELGEGSRHIFPLEDPSAPKASAEYSYSRTKLYDPRAKSAPAPLSVALTQVDRRERESSPDRALSPAKTTSTKTDCAVWQRTLGALFLPFTTTLFRGA